MQMLGLLLVIAQFINYLFDVGIITNYYKSLNILRLHPSFTSFCMKLIMEQGKKDNLEEGEVTLLTIDIFSVCIFYSNKK